MVSTAPSGMDCSSVEGEFPVPRTVLGHGGADGVPALVLTGGREDR